MDDQCVGARNVDAGFHDGRGEQHIRLAVIERHHAVFEVGRRHLPVRRQERHLRHLLPQIPLEERQVRHARRHEIALPAPEPLAQQRFADGHRIELDHIGPHGKAIYRRRRDDRQVANTRQRHLQRPRNRRRRQRQHVHVRLQLLQPLLVLHAKALLLVDDDHAQPLEVDPLAEQRVRADHDIATARIDLVLRLARFLRRHEA